MHVVLSLQQLEAVVLVDLDLEAHLIKEQTETILP
jgi:hypothetical protein